MKITNKQLKQIIKEELEKVMSEAYFSDPEKTRREELRDISQMPINELIEALYEIEAEPQEATEIIELLENDKEIWGTKGWMERIRAVAKYILKQEPDDEWAQRRVYNWEEDVHGDWIIRGEEDPRNKWQY